MEKNKSAFLWDESFLWGLMAYRALKGCGLRFDLLRAEDIKHGALDHYAMLFVPGGWASNKGKALGEAGIEAVRRFVQSGGSYLGFCGGAGLATKARGGIGLLDVQRKPTANRVPSFSGRIKVTVNDHPVWEAIRKNQSHRTTDDGQRTTNIFHAWWPSQFVVNRDSVNVLASFGDALPDAFSSDLNVGDVAGGWSDLEALYQILLDPRRLSGEPAVVEGIYGRGKVVLSLLHFDTPDDEKGQRVLLNLWNYLGGECGGISDNPHVPGKTRCNVPLENMCADLIAFGERNFLWFWRNRMLLQWRRGVRGLEYNALYILAKEIAEIVHTNYGGSVPDRVPALESIEMKVREFVEHAKELLLLERFELQKGPITYIQCDNPDIQRLRTTLFGSAKSHGGMFKEVLDAVDRLLYELLKNC